MIDIERISQLSLLHEKVTASVDQGDECPRDIPCIAWVGH